MNTAVHRPYVSSCLIEIRMFLLVFLRYLDSACRTRLREITSVVDDDVAGLSGGAGADHAGARDDLADQGVLLLGDVHFNLRLVPVTAHHTTANLAPMSLLRTLKTMLPMNTIPRNYCAGRGARPPFCPRGPHFVLVPRQRLRPRAGHATLRAHTHHTRGKKLTAWPRGSPGRRHRGGWGPRDQSRPCRQKEPWGWRQPCGWRGHQRGHCDRTLRHTHRCKHQPITQLHTHKHTRICSLTPDAFQLARRPLSCMPPKTQRPKQHNWRSRCKSSRANASQPARHAAPPAAALTHSCAPVLRTSR